jgi:hypothetical protein
MENKNAELWHSASDFGSKLVGTVKFCRFYRCKRCFHESCSWIDSNGNVKLCNLHRNPFGRFTRRFHKEVR